MIQTFVAAGFGDFTRLFGTLYVRKDGECRVVTEELFERCGRDARQAWKQAPPGVPKESPDEESG